METYEERIKRYADTMAIFSDYNGELNNECLDPFAELWRTNPALLSKELKSIGDEIISLQPNNSDGTQVNLDITKKYVNDNYSAVRNHLLSNGYINKPDHTYKWILNDEGKLVKRLGSHAKYQEYKKQELGYQTENARLQYEDYPRVQRRAKAAIIISILALLVTIVLGVIKLKCQ